MKTMAKLLQGNQRGLLLFAFFMTVGCISGIAQEGQPYLVKEFAMNEPGILNVQTSGGSISVSSHENNMVRVEMFVRIGGEVQHADSEDAREALEDYEIDISKTGNTVSAKAERQSQGWFGSSNNSSVSFTVYVPARMAGNLKTSGGSISVRGLTGNQEVRTSGGSLELSNINGNMLARTSGGSINIENYRGVLDAHTSGGSITLNDATGEITVHTSGGSINLEDVSGSIEASTSGGGIRANLLSLEKHLKLKTSGGSITAVVPSGLGLDLRLKGNGVNTKLSNFNGEAGKNSIIGSINGGGIPVELDTSGGSVNLDYH